MAGSIIAFEDTCPGEMSCHAGASTNRDGIFTSIPESCLNY